MTLRNNPDTMKAWAEHLWLYFFLSLSDGTPLRIVRLKLEEWEYADKAAKRAARKARWR